MNIDDMFQSKWLAAADVPEDGDLALTITKVEAETFKNKQGVEEAKPILYFQEHKKGMVLNKTNASTIKDLYGKMTPEWIGKRIALFATEVDFEGRQTMSLRIRMKAPKANGAAAPATNGGNNGVTQSYAARYQELVDEATSLGMVFPMLDPAADDADIIAAGKALKAKIAEAQAEAF